MTPRHRLLLFAPILLLLTGARHADAQASRLTLQEALDLARGHSTTVKAARAGEQRAEADEQQVLSQRLPQLSFASTYTRTLASEFSGAFQSTGPVCDPLAVDATQPLASRVSELERAASCGAIGPSFSFGKLPFGQKNIYQVAFAFSQSVYTGGRLGAARAQSGFSRRAASLATTTAEAQVLLEVTQAFYDAALSDRLVAIAESGFDQANATYDQVRLAYEAGRQPEFELLRAQVARDNQRPAVIRNRAARDVAYLRLRQLLGLQATAPLVLDVDLDAADIQPPAPFATALAAARAAGPSDDRAPVRQAETVVSLRQAGISAARAERLPTVALNSSLSRVGYPSEGVLPGVGDFRTNWSASATLQVPILTGGRLVATERAARASLAEAEAQLAQARELSLLDSATALQDLTAAEAALEASAGTIEQAQRAYQIAELRNREGLSTQLELSDSRLSLQIAQANRAQAARDVQVARARVALLPTLPLGAR